MYKLGIDVGGTNTDAVLIDEDLAIVAAVKHPTSANITRGIMGAMDAVLEASGVDRTQIKQAMLGTTQCTNAIVERKGLAPIAVLRIGAPATVGIPPMVDWADDIRAVSVAETIIEGGFEYDGKRLAECTAESKRSPSRACSRPCATMTSCVPPRSQPRCSGMRCTCRSRARSDRWASSSARTRPS